MEEGRRKKEEGRRKKAIFGHRLPLPSSLFHHPSHFTHDAPALTALCFAALSL
jgi:hypothetical protein